MIHSMDIVIYKL